MLTVVTSSTDGRLTTLDKLKGLLGVATSDQDELLSDALLAATDSIAQFLGYYPLQQTYRETLAGYGDNAMLLSALPVTSVAAMYYLSTGMILAPTEYRLEQPTAGIIVRDLGFPWSAGIEWDLDSHIAPGSEKRTFIVDYTAGWTFSTDGPRTLPNDIERAALETAKGLYKSGKRDPTISSKTVGSLSVSYRNGKESEYYALPSSAMAWLGSYRKVV